MEIEDDLTIIVIRNGSFEQAKAWHAGSLAPMPVILTLSTSPCSQNSLYGVKRQPEAPRSIKMPSTSEPNRKSLWLLIKLLHKSDWFYDPEGMT